MHTYYGKGKPRAWGVETWNYMHLGLLRRTNHKEALATEPVQKNEYLPTVSTCNLFTFSGTKEMR